MPALRAGGDHDRALERGLEHEREHPAERGDEHDRGDDQQAPAPPRHRRSLAAVKRRGSGLGIVARVWSGPPPVSDGFGARLVVLQLYDIGALY